MKDIVKFCVIMHNMMIECRGEGYVEHSGVKQDKHTVVREGAAPLWSLKRHGEGEVPPAGSIGVICGLHRFMWNESEYYEIRRLVMEHLWQRSGETES